MLCCRSTKVVLLSRKAELMRRHVKILLGVSVLVAVCIFASPVFADSESVSGCSGCNSYSFQAELTPPTGGGSTYQLSYKIINGSSTAATPQSWSLTLFQPGNNVSATFTDFHVKEDGVEYNDAYTVDPGKSNNGSNGNCNSGLSAAICVTTSGAGTLPTLAPGQSITFSFDFDCSNCSELSAWDFLSHGTCTTGSGNCYAISAYGTGGSTNVDEPSVPTLLVAQLLLMAAILGLFPSARRKFYNAALALRWRPRPIS